MRFAVLMLAMLAATSLHAGKPIPHARVVPHGQAASDPMMIEVPDSHVVGEYQDWQVLQSSALVAALTQNDTGSLFGLMCGTSCTYYVNASVGCLAGHVYSGLINAAAGAMPLTLRCAHIKEEGEQYAIFLIDEDLSDELADSEEISITLPLEDGAVETAHFSMAGAEEAQQDMLDIAEDQPDAPGDMIKTGWSRRSQPATKAELGGRRRPQKGNQLPFSRNRI